MFRTLSVAALVAAGLAGSASATVVTSTLGEFNFDGADDGSSPAQTVGIFSFLLPLGESILSATVSGTFGNSTVYSTAAVDLFGDGAFLGECVFNDVCWTGAQGLTPYSFAVTNLADLLDGLFEFAIQQDGPYYTRLGEATLTINTGPTAVPLPAGLPLLLAGLGGLALLRRRGSGAA